MSAAYPHALSPLSIRGVELRNRIVSTAHTTGYTSDGKVTDDLIAYHRARADGGTGLIVLEGGSVHPSFVSGGLRYHDEDGLAGLTALAAVVRPTGARLFGQLMHGGVQSGAGPNGSPPLSASPTLGPTGTMARAMTPEEIDDVVAGFVRGGRLLSRAGFDGCEVHLGHGYLLAQFLSPLYNRRADEYGGSLENRLRLTTRILDGLSAVRGNHFVVGVRVGPDAVSGGLDGDAVSQVIDHLERAGLIDYVNLTLGNYAPTADVLQVAPMDHPAGYQLAWNESTARAAKVPVIVTGRFRTLEEADRVVGDGIAQLVGMTRAQIADPEIVGKTVAAVEAQVRPCIACNECVLSRYTSGPLRCSVNPDLPAGHGTDDVTPADEPRTVLVVGGGPAGLEAARSAALRGHRIELVDAGPRLGGVARTVADNVPAFALIGDVLDWYERELDRLGVSVRLDTRLEPKEIRDLAADVVVVATGGVSGSTGSQSGDPGVAIRGTELAHVHRGAAVFDVAHERLGSTAVVLDSLGTYAGLAISEYLVERGLRVTFLTHFAGPGQMVGLGRRVIGSLTRLAASGRFDAVPLAVVDAITPDAVDWRPLGGGDLRTVAAQTVVLLLGEDPETEIPAALTDAQTPVALIGDALAGRGLRAAVADAHLAGKGI